MQCRTHFAVTQQSLYTKRWVRQPAQHAFLKDFQAVRNNSVPELVL